MPTPDQQDIIDGVTRLLQAEPAVEAAWLAGSLGKGQGDEFSDVDILVLATDRAASELCAGLPEKLEAVARPVLVNRLFDGRVTSVVTDDWRRFDISVIEAARLADHNADELEPLFNRSARTPPSKPQRDYSTAPEDLLKLVNEFLRVLGLAYVGVGRQEYVLCLWGVGLLRNMVLDLMLEENSIAPWARGGALHRNVFLTREQQDELVSLPPQSADRESVIAAQAALAKIFLPRARRLADRIGMAWPTEFEDATRRSLSSRLRLEF